MKTKMLLMLTQAVVACCCHAHSLSATDTPSENAALLQIANPSRTNWFAVRFLKKNHTLSLKDFNAVGDGVADDTEAIEKWLAAGRVGFCLHAPAGTYAFSSPLSIATPDIAIVGEGPYQTVFKYIGSDSDTDLISIGSPAYQIANMFLEGFKIQSATQMTGGAGLHLKGVCRSQLRDIVADGQDGNGNLYHGIWFDEVDFVRLDGFEARASQDGIRVNGAVGDGPKGDLFLSGGKILFNHVGIHVGGAFGGLIVDDCDVIANNINVSIDTTIASERNRELFFKSGCMVDGATTGDGFLIDDALVSNGTLYIGGWVASSAQHGINVQHWNGAISIESPTIFNCVGDGLHVEDPNAIIDISGSTVIRNNGGYGVNSTVATNGISPGPAPYANALGGYAPNTHVDFTNSQSGYYKFANGKILQWTTVSVTGPANTLIAANGGDPVLLPIPFPNYMEHNSMSANPYGFANGAISMTATCSPFSTTGAFVHLVASGDVVNPQTIRIVVWGW